MGTAVIEYLWMDAELLARPSFAYPLIEVVNGNTIRKIHGFCAGLEIRFLNGKAIAKHDRDVCLRYAEVMLDPDHHADPDAVRGLREPLASIARELFAFYRGFTVLSSPMDDLEMFASIAMSRYTSFHANTVRWVRRMEDYFGGLLERIAWSEPEELMLVARARSYQVTDLPESFRHYLTIRFRILEELDWRRVRVALMYARSIGPKIADAYLLFVKRVRSAVPTDRNLLRLLDRLGIKGLRPPDKRFCMRYDCRSCPLAPRCARKFVSDSLGNYAGLFQTIVYVHTDVFCEQHRCNLCPIRGFCSAYSQGYLGSG